MSNRSESTQSSAAAEQGGDGGLSNSEPGNPQISITDSDSKRLVCGDCGVKLPRKSMLVHRASSHPINALFMPSKLEQLIPLAVSVFAFDDGSRHVFPCRLGICSFSVSVQRHEFMRGHHALVGHLLDHVYEQTRDRTIIHVHRATSMLNVYKAIVSNNDLPADPKFPDFEDPNQLQCLDCGIDLPGYAMMHHMTRVHPYNGVYKPGTIEQLVPLVAATFAFDEGSHHNFRCRLLSCSFNVRVPSQDYARGHEELMRHLYNHVYVQRDGEEIFLFDEFKAMFEIYTWLNSSNN